MKKMFSKQKILVVAAHPDDEILGCGGTMKLLSENENEVFVCIVTEGSTAQYAGDTIKYSKKIDECRAANKVLGVKEVIFLDQPDMRLEKVDHVDLNKVIEDVFKTLQPNIVFTHTNTDVNLDHSIVNRSLEVISRPGKKYLSKIFEYEVPSSSEWSLHNSFKPNTYINIEKYIEDKKRSFSLYETEIRRYPHPRSLEGIEVFAKYRGLESGYKYAESFKLVKSYDEI